MNSIKKYSKTMNSSKNKLNSEINLIFHFNPNGHLLLLLQYIYIYQPNLT